MQKLSALLISGVIISTIACQPKSKVADEKNNNESADTQEVVLSPAEIQGKEMLEKCLQAHGGLESWNAFEGLDYTLINNGNPVYQLTHLKDRRAYIKSEDYEVGFDGKVAWATPDMSKLPGKSAAFYYNLDFYFIGIPFVLKDPGVSVTYEGKSTIDSLEYESIKVTFGSGVGLTPKDVYYLYIDPESNLLKILVYSISYFDKSETQTLGSAKVYSDYKPTQGLLMPGKMENFVWEDGKLGASKNHLRVFEKIRFLKEIPDEKKFAAPEGAVMEEI
ncbi:DUF6503 family protein [Fulvivirgaceae bacterium BMA12]|uniref:DUF6503 family protein n=1 Tax=Agaribacillus aureus TaxID=3051825 RepID=A0ABT8L1W9_9BACT|nr:DUF6503 family protein [Fulvivirgaceae bacterium BMA12]